MAMFPDVVLVKRNAFSFFLLFLIQTVASDVTVSADGCGVTKGCWFEPTDCQTATATGNVVDSCNYVFTWTPNENWLELELASNVSMLSLGHWDFGPGKYVAVAFSKDDKMGEDSVAECVATTGGQVHAYMSYNDDTHNIRLKQASKAMLSNVSGSYVDGKLSCRFRRVWAPSEDMTDQRSLAYNLSSRDWVLQLAIGNADPETDTIGIHYMTDGDLFPFVARKSINLYKPEFLKVSKHYDIPRSIQYQLVMAHGILLLIGWWIFGTLSFFMGRYFKTMWPGKKLFGTKVWYQLHRDVIVVGLVLQCVGFGLVYIQAGDWKSCSITCNEADYYLYLHTILGVACTAAAIIQPFIGWIRPGPEDAKRPLFNWVHWFLGMGSWVLATITIFVSPPLGKSGLRRNFGYMSDYLMAGYIASYKLTCIAMEVLIQISERRKGLPVKVGQVENGIPLSIISGPMPTGVYTKPSDSSPRFGWARVLTLGLFLSVALGIVIALSCLICMNAH